ncbi:MAG: alpha-L-arabinofuranosidase C-terminal domain-containing protein [bacterium]
MATTPPQWNLNPASGMNEPQQFNPLAYEKRELIIDLDQEIGIIKPELHGHFAEHLGSCVYGGLWVGPSSPIPNINGFRSMAIQYLRELGVPVLRWPGGCFADDYHWRDGIGPSERRPKRVNLWWGQVIEDNAFGTHEFINLCRLIGAQPYLAGNVGSGSPQELRDWIEYCNFPGGSTLSNERIANGSVAPFGVSYWGIGNESWCCGGQMTPEEYAAQYNRFSAYLRAYGGVNPFLIACGPESSDMEWTRRFFAAHKRKYAARINGYAMHFYSWGKSTSRSYTTSTLQEQLATFADLERAIVEQGEFLDEINTGVADPQRRTGLMIDEWGLWDKSSPEDESRFGMLFQWSTMRQAVATGLALNIFHRHADKLVMCNVAQIANVLHALLLTHNEQCIRTPAYWAFMMCKAHQSRHSLKVDHAPASECDLSISASRDQKELIVTAVNPFPERPISVTCAIRGGNLKIASAQILSHDDFNTANTFHQPDAITPKAYTIITSESSLQFILPPLSLLSITASIA